MLSGESATDSPVPCDIELRLGKARQKSAKLVYVTEFGQSAQANNRCRSKLTRADLAAATKKSSEQQFAEISIHKTYSQIS